MNFGQITATAYPWLKALHIVAMVAWMAGIFYLPRLLVYHAGSKRGSEQSETFKVMEGRLFRVIMNPAMIATWVLGLSLAAIGDWWTAHWFEAKIALVVLLTFFHMWLGARVRDFALDANRHAARTYRIVNELPTLLVLAIVILAVVKPF